MKTAEHWAAEITDRHKLTTLHLFTSHEGWKVFGFRKDPKGYQASAESGAGTTIISALENLNERLIEGPIHR